MLICGPCSAETEEQLLATAEALAAMGIKIFRAGLWKPRTRPGSFEGVGEKGLYWLKSVKEKTGLLTAVEAATPRHADKCLKHGVDIIWLGARTVSNPFSVQEIVKAIEGTDIPVLVKNPLNPDMELWCGAIERVAKAGIKRVAAVHRGFYPFEKTSLRNIPKWEVPIELKTCFNDLPVICDPSHIAGSTRYIEEISQKALDLNMDGLMIEVHIDPSSALSDARQQLTPEELAAMLGNLIVRTPTSSNSAFTSLLETYRDQIDSIDAQLIELLSQRMKIVDEIGRYKSENNVTILQLRRWENIIRTRTEQGKKLDLTDEFIKKILQIVHKESIQRQTEIMMLLKERNRTKSSSE